MISDPRFDVELGVRAYAPARVADSTNLRRFNGSSNASEVPESDQVDRNFKV
jgi:hypothetical protein